MWHQILQVLSNYTFEYSNSTVSYKLLFGGGLLNCLWSLCEVNQIEQLKQQQSNAPNRKAFLKQSQVSKALFCNSNKTDITFHFPLLMIYHSSLQINMALWTVTSGKCKKWSYDISIERQTIRFWALKDNWNHQI